MNFDMGMEIVGLNFENLKVEDYLDSFFYRKKI